MRTQSELISGRLDQAEEGAMSRDRRASDVARARSRRGAKRVLVVVDEEVDLDLPDAEELLGLIDCLVANVDGVLREMHRSPF